MAVLIVEILGPSSFEIIYTAITTKISELHTF